MVHFALNIIGDNNNMKVFIWFMIFLNVIIILIMTAIIIVIDYTHFENNRACNCTHKFEK